jgi:hypothetical protein
LTTVLEIPLQEARSRFSVDIEPEDAVNIDPLDGFLGPEGSATLHFKRSSNSASMGRINCKVCLTMEPKTWLNSDPEYPAPSMKMGNKVLSMSEISIAALAFVDSDIGSGPILK